MRTLIYCSIYFKLVIFLRAIWHQFIKLVKTQFFLKIIFISLFFTLGKSYRNIYICGHTEYMYYFNNLVIDRKITHGYN